MCDFWGSEELEWERRVPETGKGWVGDTGPWGGGPGAPTGGRAPWAAGTLAGLATPLEASIVF